MIKDSNIIYIMNKAESSAFYTNNIKVLGKESKKLGQSAGAIAKLLTNMNELKVLMPQILAIAPTSMDWDKRVHDYWNSFTIDVFDELGKELETGFEYNISDNTNFPDGKSRLYYINELIKRVPTIKDDESLMAYVKGANKKGELNVREEEKYKYARAINPEEYLLWRYCIVCPMVSNTIDTVDASPKIRFYLFDKTSAESAKKKQFKLLQKAQEKYHIVIADSEMIDTVLYVFRRDLKNEDGTPMDATDKAMALDIIVKTKPTEFLTLLTDKNLTTKALIERYIALGIFKRLSNSSIIVNAKDPSEIIGNNIDDAITYFNNPDKKIQVNTYAAECKSLK